MAGAGSGSAYGIGAWGTGMYGAAATGIELLNAIVTSTNTVVVTTSSEPKHEDPFALGDALNPQTWKISRLDTGELFTVLAARDFDPPCEFELAVLEDFASHLIEHRVESDTLLSVGGILITTPDSFDFPGVVTTFDPTAATAARRFESRDIANPPLQDRVGGFGGTLVIASDGDYATESGADLVKKLVIRRLITQKGEFIHLPDYGIGLAVKEPIPGGDIVALRSEIERQTLLEPDVAKARAYLTRDRRNILTILLRVELAKTGQQVEIGINADPRTGQVIEF